MGTIANMQMNSDYRHQEPKLSIASDPAAAYSYNHQNTLIVRARNGITNLAFNKWCKSVHRTVLALSDVLPASYSSLTKLKLYDKKTSEHILELMKLFAYGIDVFGKAEKFNHWLDTASPALGGDTPFSLLDTSFGINLVTREIAKIDYGLPV